ncbi:hypothetical protein DPMN_113468 [Dreissena polymorpha]|uniref:Uncharacterized protein n=1 Tax=Dreissena polymorpha TaxID=45954 RepID=A0A9D4KJ47_DREPO|nr:hypothetical protein DPMN_113468 [Dreissena polymorpha]
MVLLHRCKGNIMTSIRKLQGGFQDELGCIMTSFSLRECLNYSREHSPPVVWHDGLFYKLSSLTSGDDFHTPGIDANSLVAIRDKPRALPGNAIRATSGTPGNPPERKELAAILTGIYQRSHFRAGRKWEWSVPL